MYALTVKRNLILVHNTVNPLNGHLMPQKFKLQHSTTTKENQANIGINH